MAENGTLGKHRNRHHLLYPARVWRSIGPNSLMLRGAFIIKIDERLHAQLHRELDGFLGDNIIREKLPCKNTIKHLKREYKKHELQVRMMNPIQKLEWLENEINPGEKRNVWLFSMLDMQRRFLIAHIEEM